MEDQFSTDKAVWFVAGAALGATIALLFAPVSGADARRHIGRKTREGREVLTVSSRDMYERGQDLLEKGRQMADRASEMLNRGKQIVEKAAESAEQSAADTLG